MPPGIIVPPGIKIAPPGIIVPQGITIAPPGITPSAASTPLVVHGRVAHVLGSSTTLVTAVFVYLKCSVMLILF